VTRLEWPRRVAALGQFRVADPGEPVLTKDDEHHLRHVLRARSGEEVVVTDGAGAWSICLVKETTLERVTDVVLDEPTPADDDLPRAAEGRSQRVGRRQGDRAGCVAHRAAGERASHRPVQGRGA
jgi:hypothetical protein